MAKRPSKEKQIKKDEKSRGRLLVIASSPTRLGVPPWSLGRQRLIEQRDDVWDQVVTRLVQKGIRPT